MRAFECFLLGLGAERAPRLVDLALIELQMFVMYGYVHDLTDREHIEQVIQLRRAHRPGKAEAKTLSLPDSAGRRPVTVQLSTSSGACWEATYGESDVRRN